MVSEASAQHCAELEFECNSTGSAFASLISELKLGIPVYEDLINKAQKLSGAFRILLLASSAFLDSFQKIADLASSSNGSTRELGAALTRICLKQRTIESRAKSYSGHLQDSLAAPLSDRLEAWRRQTQQLEKERHRELKRLRSDAKRSAGSGGSVVYGGGGGSGESLRLGRRRRQSSGSQLMDSGQLERALAESLRWQERQLTVERHWLRLARQEGRSRLACFLACLKPGLDLLAGLADEFGHLRDLTDRMARLTNCCDDGSDASASLMALTNASAASNLAGGGGAHRRSFSPAPSVNSHGSAESDLYGAIGGGCGSSASSSSTMRVGAILLPGMPASTLRHGVGGTGTGGGGSGVASSDSGFISQELRPPSPPPAPTSKPHFALSSTSTLTSCGGQDNDGQKEGDTAADYEEADAASVTSSTSAASDTAATTAASATNFAATEADQEQPRLRHPQRLQQLLYPDQSLPAPVYSNLGELQRNAARRRKFSFSSNSTGTAAAGENPCATLPPPPPPMPPPLPPPPSLSMVASSPSLMSSGTATLRRASVDFSSSAYLTAVAAAAVASAAASSSASSSSTGAVPVPPPTVPFWQRQISEPPPLPPAPPTPPHSYSHGSNNYYNHRRLWNQQQQRQQPATQKQQQPEHYQSSSFRRFVCAPAAAGSIACDADDNSGLPPPPPGF